MSDGTPTLSRRQLLRYTSLLLAGGGTAFLAACGGSTATPTQGPGATTPAVTSTAAASAAPSAAPPAATATKPAGAGTTPPASRANTPGKDLIGTIEGPTLITDPAQFPKQFSEAPQLAELVKAGKLPPIAERIGQDPLVFKPLRATGKYGGCAGRLLHPQPAPGTPTPRLPEMYAGWRKRPAQGILLKIALSDSTTVQIVRHSRCCISKRIDTSRVDSYPRVQ